MSADVLRDKAHGEASETVRSRVEAARNAQLERQGKVNALLTTTIADLAGQESLAANHISEAIGYRRGMDAAA